MSKKRLNKVLKLPINPVPVAMKTPSVATYKIIKQGEKGVYQIVREDGTDIVYINFGAMLKSISRDDLTELYRIVMNRYGVDGPEDKLEKGFWKCLRIMVHCLNLESMDVYMLSERKYPLSAEANWLAGWQWPQTWLLKAPDLGLVPVPNLVADRPDIFRWRNRNGVFSDFSVSNAWEAIRPYGIEVWRHVRHLPDMDVVPSTAQDIVSHLLPLSNKRTAKSIIGRLVLAAAAYFVWIERNNRLFKKIKRPPKEIRDLIMGVPSESWSLFSFTKGFPWEGFLRRQSHLDSSPPYTWKVDVAAWKLCKLDWHVS
ncbi:hypothetical protein Tco_0952358 [Tanacetum coccineum]|uniref:Reverse transcriptase zinc-binding domain-containing protein n=1 Tax=Tanacetum coccineum TaxID=301880 RepID=A0ABQ5DXD3_9ASTR